jgi:hypothetical protein
MEVRITYYEGLKEGMQKLMTQYKVKMKKYCINAVYTLYIHTDRITRNELKVNMIRWQISDFLPFFLFL